MSNHLAIANVTAAIGQVAHAAALSAVSGVGVRYGRPNTTDTGSRVNVYLYQVSPNPNLRNMDLPSRGADGLLSNRPRAALDLHYIVSFYGKTDQFEPERMAGAVARDFHARPVLDPAVLANAVASNLVLADSDLSQAVERVTVTPVALTLDDTSRLWSVLVQSPHALSLVYAACVVVIDALEGGPAALPVLRRGEDGRGALTALDRIPRLGEAWIGFPDTVDRQPALASLRAAALGLRVRVSGTDLDGDRVVLIFARAGLAPVVLEAPSIDRDAGRLTFSLPDDAAAATLWAAGVYEVTAQVTRGEETLVAPVWPMLLAPRINSLSPNPAGPVGAAVAVEVTCRPQVLPTQKAVLRVGAKTIVAEPRALAADPLVFIFDPAPALEAALVWLSVDGVESAPVLIDPVTDDLAFDDGQRLTIS